MSIKHVINISSTLESELDFEMNLTANMRMTHDFEKFATQNTAMLMVLEIVTTRFIF